MTAGCFPVSWAHSTCTGDKGQQRLADRADCVFGATGADEQFLPDDIICVHSPVRLLSAVDKAAAGQEHSRSVAVISSQSHLIPMPAPA